MRSLLFTVGNEMMGDDAAGPLLAQMLMSYPVEGWEVLDAGNAPENWVFKVREMAPERVLIVDAADMELQAGDVRAIERNQIGSLSLMTTHALPLSYLMQSMEEFVPCVDMIGIQPEIVEFGHPVSETVKDAVERVYKWLKENPDGRGAAERI